MKPLEEWVETEVKPAKKRGLRWLSQNYFHRDPYRPAYIDRTRFFSPADGIILYQTVAKPDEDLLDIKGTPYTVQDALRDPDYDRECLVVGIFLTFYDPHIQRIPYPGRLSWEEMPPLVSKNLPMLDVEKWLIDELIGDREPDVRYVAKNQRVLNTIHSSQLGGEYYVLQVADYDVDCITPFNLNQNMPVHQGARFSMIRYGSQVELIIPTSDRYQLETVHPVSSHVEAGQDTLIKIT